VRRCSALKGAATRLGFEAALLLDGGDSRRPSPGCVARIRLSGAKQPWLAAGCMRVRKQVHMRRKRHPIVERDLHVDLYRGTERSGAACRGKAEQLASG
jgi:hypothetical protein